MSARKKIVMICDAVTMAHPLRAVTLLNTLSPEDYDVVFYCADTYRAHMPTSRHPIKPIGSMSPQEFNAKVQHSEVIYTSDIVARYVEEELRILDTEKPDLVIGDFRLTLQISARARRVPYLTLLDAHWSPYTNIPYRLMDIPPARVIPLSLIDAVVNALPALSFAPHTRAINRMRAQHGLAPHHDIRRMYADADAVAYPNLPLLFADGNYPGTHHFIGFVDPAFAIDVPAWWADMPTDKPLIYINLGSSGSTAQLLTLVQQLARATDATLMVATSTQALADAMPSGVFAAPFISNAQAIARAAAMIGNGGVLSATAAALAGCYYIALPANMDQVMSMQPLVRHGLGACYRQPRRDLTMLVAHAASLPHADAAVTQKLQSQSAEYDVAARFHALLKTMLS